MKNVQVRTQMQSSLGSRRGAAITPQHITSVAENFNWLLSIRVHSYLGPQYCEWCAQEVLGRAASPSCVMTHVEEELQDILETCSSVSLQLPLKITDTANSAFPTQRRGRGSRLGLDLQSGSDSTEYSQLEVNSRDSPLLQASPTADLLRVACRLTKNSALRGENPPLCRYSLQSEHRGVRAQLPELIGSETQHLAGGPRVEPSHGVERSQTGPRVASPEVVPTAEC